MDLDAQLLGPLEILTGGKALALGGPRSCRLLAVLLLNANSVVQTDRLVDVMWEVTPRSARQQIHNTVGVLRRVTESVAGLDIVTSRLGYRIDIDSGRLDLTRFRAHVRQANDAMSGGDPDTVISLLTSARGLWRGTPLAGLDGEYFVNARTRLAEERLSATELLLELRVRRGDGALVMGELIELVASHPSRESLRASLMAALHSTGRQAEALEVYEEGRRLLVEEFGLDPSDELKALHERILHGMPIIDSPATKRAPTPLKPLPAADAAAQQPNRRRFLPHDPREFSGRRHEIRQLTEDCLQSGSVSLVISAINGMAGIGKTALAVRFAHTVSADYPDGQYFVDVRGSAVGVEPLSSADALGILLRQCGFPDELIPPDLEGRASAWRGAMAGKRALVLLDNVVDVEQVRPLLPGTNGPLVLITSRRRLPGLEGAVPLPLDLMPLDDAVALFVRIVGAQRLAGHEVHLADVVELCGRLPLAIRAAAARFRERTSWTVQYLIEQLSDQEQRARFFDFGEQSVSAVLALSYRCLSADHRRLFRLLSHYPGPDFTAPVAAVLAAQPTDRVQHILESLLDDNLILEVRPGRYRIHDLVRDHTARAGREHDSGQIKGPALRRLLDHHLQCAATWCAPLAKRPFRLIPSGPAIPGIRVPASAAEAVELLDQEGANLIEVARTALNEGPPETAWQLVCALQPFLRRANYAGIALELFENAVVAARSAGDEHGEALSLLGLGCALRERGRTSDACAALKAGIAISRRRGDKSTEMYQLDELGGLKAANESFREAYECFRSALGIAETLSDLELSAKLKNNLGITCGELGCGPEGFNYFARALPPAGQTAEIR